MNDIKVITIVGKAYLNILIKMYTKSHKSFRMLKL